MELHEAIHGRRAGRRYLTTPVPEATLERLFDAAQWAPSWAHTQCPELVVVSHPEKKKALQECILENNPSYKAMLIAPLAVAFCARTGKSGFKKGEAATPRGDWMMFDVALAMQNFMLAAHAEGLATVCIGMFDASRAARALAAPPGVEVVALTPLGFPDGETKAPPRKSREDFTHRESY